MPDARTDAPGRGPTRGPGDPAPAGHRGRDSHPGRDPADPADPADDRGADERGASAPTDPADPADPMDPMDPSDPADPAERRQPPPVAARARRPQHDLGRLRRRYGAGHLDESDLAPTWVEQFDAWFADASVPESGIPEPNAMVFATADADGRPSARTVLLKGFDAAGFVLYTNYGSRKGHESAANPFGSLVFPWYALERQVIVVGSVERVAPELSAAYFRSRPRGSQLGAWASRQSSVLSSREELERRDVDLATRWPPGVEIPVPPFWGGLLVIPESVEFWQGRPDRLHDRLRYRRQAAPTAPPTGAEGPGRPATNQAGWTVERLSP